MLDLRHQPHRTLTVIPSDPLCILSNPMARTQSASPGENNTILSELKTQGLPSFSMIPSPSSQSLQPTHSLQALQTKIIRKPLAYDSIKHFNILAVKPIDFIGVITFTLLKAMALLTLYLVSLPPRMRFLAMYRAVEPVAQALFTCPLKIKL